MDDTVVEREWTRLGDFLQGIYGVGANNVWVTGFRDIEQGAKWHGMQGLTRLRATGLNPFESDLYFCIGAMRPGADRRSNQNVIAQPLLIVDDVGTKVPVERWEAMFAAGCPLPSFEIETSPGNFTWGWVLAGDWDTARSPQRFKDMVLLRAYLLERGLTDNVMDEARYIRLPGGWNSKSKYRAPGTGAEHSPRVKLHASRGGSHWPVDVDVLGGALVGVTDWRNAPMPTGAGAALMNSAQIAGALGTGALPRTATMTRPEPIIRLAEVLGMNPRQSGPGVVEANCPNIAAHTTRADTGFAFLGGGLMHCHHASCQGLRTPDFKEMMEEAYDARATVHRALGTLGADEPETAGEFLARAAFGLDGSGGLAGSSTGDVLGIAADMAARGAAHDAMVAQDTAAGIAGLVGRYVWVQRAGVWFDTVDRVVLSEANFDRAEDVVQVIPVGGGGKKRASNVLLNSPGMRWVTNITSAVGNRRPIVDALDEKGQMKPHANVWHPGRVTRVAGKPTAWLELAEYLIPHREPREWIIKWMAFILQNPGVRHMGVVVLKGGQGTGKDMFLGPFLECVGQHNVAVVGAGAFGSRWNSWLRSQVVVLPELRLDAQGAAYNTIKESLSKGDGHWVMVDEKFREPYPVQVVSSFFALTNHADALRGMEWDDRRLQIYVSEVQRANPAFYARIAAALGTKDELGRVLDYLLTLNLQGFDPYTPIPDVNGSRAAMLAGSLSGVAEWVYHQTQAGGLFAGRLLVSTREAEDAARAARVLPHGAAYPGRSVATGLRAAGWAPFEGGAVKSNRMRTAGAGSERLRVWMAPGFAPFAPARAKDMRALYAAEQARALGLAAPEVSPEDQETDD